MIVVVSVRCMSDTYVATWLPTLPGDVWLRMSSNYCMPGCQANGHMMPQRKRVTGSIVITHEDTDKGGTLAAATGRGPNVDWGCLGLHGILGCGKPYYILGYGAPVLWETG